MCVLNTTTVASMLRFYLSTTKYGIKNCYFVANVLKINYRNYQRNLKKVENKI